MSSAVESPILAPHSAPRTSHKTDNAVRCKICRGCKLLVHAHTAKCQDCGVLLFWPYPKTDPQTPNREWTTWRRERVLRWYTESSFYNHINFTNIVLFVLGESQKGREFKVLDYGAGGGQFALVCKSLFPQAAVFTTDLSDESLLDEWKPLNSQIPFRLFADDPTQYDAIFLNDVLEHVSDPSDVLRQLKGKLNTNGVIFVDTPKQFWLYPVIRFLSKTLYTKLLWATVHESHLQLWTKRSFMHALQHAGLRPRTYLETCEFTMPADYYLDNMGIRDYALRLLGRLFYRFARYLANNKIFAVLELSR
jgi:2-polyprenyl-3-methyl-5-hydroxy-6-metoxy-1,4-benzoquinol methylase